MFYKKASLKILVGILVANFLITVDSFAQQPPAGACDFVFFDQNDNGIFDANEAGIADYSIDVLDAGLNLVTNILSTQGGYIDLSVLAPGNYVFQASTISAFEFTAQNAGADNQDSDFDTTTGQTALYALPNPAACLGLGLTRQFAATREIQCFNSSVPLQPTDWNTTAGTTPSQFNLFDPSLGTLENVVITTEQLTAGGMILESGDAAPSFVTGTLTGNFVVEELVFSDSSTLDFPDILTTIFSSNSQNLSAIDPATSATDLSCLADFSLYFGAAPPCAGTDIAVFEFGGGIGWNTGGVVGPGVSSGNQALIFNTPIDLTRFSGTGNFAISENVSAISMANGAGNLLSIFRSQAGSNHSVCYSYFPYMNLGSHVFLDANTNGLFDVGEELAGATVELLLSDGVTQATDFGGNPVAPIVTAADGLYDFRELLQGDYVVRVTPSNANLIPIPGVDPDNDVDGDSNASSVTLTSGSVTSGVITLSLGLEPLAGVDGDSEFGNQTLDIGFWQGATIGDFVWFDRDEDGIQDANEPGRNGVTVRLLDSSLNLIASTVTAEILGISGYYQFGSITPGDYIIEFVAPAGLGITPNSNSTTDSNDSDADPASGRTAVYTIASNESNQTIDAGLVQLSPIVCGDCDFETVTSPIRMSWNSFLEQTNILSIQNSCLSAESIDLSLFDIDGNMVHIEQRMVFPKVQQDVILNDLPGFSANSYGQVEIVFPTAGCIDGFLNYYRLEPGTDPLEPQLEFAIVLPFKDASTGTTYATYNTFQPSANPTEESKLITNWLQITNLENTPQSFTKNLFDSVGNLLESETVSIPAMGRRDLQGGHVNPGPNNIGTVEIVPTNQSARYMSQMFRYSGNTPSDTQLTAFDFGMAFHSRAGSVDCETVNVSPGGGAENWLVVANAGSSSNTITVEFEDIYGTSFGAPLTFNLPAYGQENISVNQHVTSGASAVAEICTLSGEAFITESLFYFRDPNTLSIESAYATQGSDGECGAAQAGYNTFWGQTNWLRITTTGTCQVDVDIRIYDLAGNLIIAWPEWIAPGSGRDLNLQDAPFNLPANSYGLVEVTPFPHTPGAVKAELLKVRYNADGVVDLATGTPVK